MNTGCVRGGVFVRKQDFRVDLTLRPADTDLADELANAIYRITPSFLNPLVMFEVYQPIVGSVHQTLIDLCRHGLEACAIYTLIANRPDLTKHENCGHLAYLFEDGKVVEQQTAMGRDLANNDEVSEGGDYLVHTMSIEFQNAKILANKWTGPQRAAKPVFHLVRKEDPETRAGVTS